MKPMLQTILVDDSKTQLSALAKLVSKCPGIQLAGTFTDPWDALHYLKNQKVDLLISDVELGGICGFEFISLIPTETEVIVTSSKGKYALFAFDFGCTDFLLKNVRLDRLKKAIAKVVENRARAGLSKPASQSAPAPERVFRISPSLNTDLKF